MAKENLSDAEKDLALKFSVSCSGSSFSGMFRSCSLWSVPKLIGDSAEDPVVKSYEAVMAKYNSSKAEVEAAEAAETASEKAENETSNDSKDQKTDSSTDGPTADEITAL